jgi:hypothetical protein
VPIGNKKPRSGRRTDGGSRADAGLAWCWGRWMTTFVANLGR